MNIWIKGVLVALALTLASGATLAGDVYVKGYYRSDGTYVQPHYRSAPDGNPYNNWSTQGNVNPYTGKVGTRSPYSGYGSPSLGSSGYVKPYPGLGNFGRSSTLGSSGYIKPYPGLGNFGD